MSKRLPIFYSALLLTGANLFLRFIGTSFQVYLSGRIGASGIGFLQLVMSVGSLSMIAGIAGIRTGTMYLTAEALGKKKRNSIPWILSGCFLYSIICSSIISAILFIFAPYIADHWIENSGAANALRLFSAFLPVCCLSSVMTGYYTAANRIATLTAVEVMEQFISITVTMLCLTLWAGRDTVKACQSVIFGSCSGSFITLFCLILIHMHSVIPPGKQTSVKHRILNTAAPLAIADILRSGITTLEHLMVPKRLSLNPSINEPLAEFGMVSGMVFPVLMFPACILFSLAELLIPELARCNAANYHHRISYLIKQGLKFSMFYGLLFSGLMYLSADALCFKLYPNSPVGPALRMYSILIPMLYCDTITDAMTKGLGQQQTCVKYNIITSSMDVIMLFFLLPVYGMRGYFLSFLISHFTNFLLSLRLLLMITDKQISFHIPVLSIAAYALSLVCAQLFTSVFQRFICYTAMLLSLLNLFQVFQAEDYIWLIHLIRSPNTKKSAGQAG